MAENSPSTTFNAAAGGLPSTVFCDFLKEKFGLASALKVVDEMKRLDLPLPEGQEEFLIGTEGCLILLNPYGMVLRIEITDLEESKWGADRINDSGWIIKPRGTVIAGAATLELCPGVSFERQKGQNRFLESHLLNENINFWDCASIDNIGRLPVKTPLFPEGVPVVIDRLSVIRLCRNVEPVVEAMKVYAAEADRLQEALYAPLGEMFDKCRATGQSMAAFWSMCRRYVAEGKLVSGWNEARDGDSGKSQDAADVAKAYAQRLPADTAAMPHRSFSDWLKQKGPL